MQPTPTRIEPLSPIEMLIGWNTGDQFSLSYVEMRYRCPCASCVDEHTGERRIRRESIRKDIRPVSVELVGRYAIQISWSDGHQTGIYHYDRLSELCATQGRKLASP